MILVVLGHVVPLTTDLAKFIFVFHMPFFFVMAGFLLNLDKWGGIKNYQSFAKKIFKRLLVPYYLAEFLWYPIWFVVCYKLGYLRYMWDWINENPISSFEAIFIDNNTGNGLILGQLWFLPALLVAEIIFIKLYNYLNKIGSEVFVLVIIFCSLFGLLIGKIIALPLGTDIALVSQIFMLVGILIRKYNVIEQKILKPFIIMTLMFILAFQFNSLINMTFRCYGEIFLFYSGSIAGTLLVMKLSALMTNGKIFSLISDCGRQSMIILVLHPIIANVFYEAVAATTNFPPEEFFTEPIIIASATALGVLIPLFIAKKFGRLPVLKYFCA